jgi:glutamyl/glutaminyl-tRNA synthetase
MVCSLGLDKKVSEYRRMFTLKSVLKNDYLQGITHVVRGADLLDNTARQIWLGSILNYPSLSYMHLLHHFQH